MSEYHKTRENTGWKSFRCIFQKRNKIIPFITEAIDIMRFIKKCKYQNANSKWITKQLAERSFPIRVDNSQTETYTEWEQERSNLIAFLNNINTTISHVAAHERMLQEIKKKQCSQEEHIATIKQQQSEIANLKQEIGMLQKQISHTKDYKRKKQQMADLFK
ncbi:hypothetical protein [Oceanobacillus kapialis]|uniref:Uncharacterized protein n=1 Tax=Oceanobacillus kapialis TaxID=481353 RepID=A0ABW5Q357_9BACI